MLNERCDAQERNIPIYFRSKGKKLGKYNVSVAEGEDHEDAILQVKEELVGSGEGFEGPVLAVIYGGKNVPKNI